MYKQLLKNYVEKLKKEDIIRYVENNNYNVSDKEIDIIYFYIKNYWTDFYDNKKESWERLKNDLNNNTYNEIVKLFQKYRRFI